MSIQICEYCGEYKHECKCAAATKIAELTQRVSELESECQNHVEHLTAKYQQGLAEGREKDITSKAALLVWYERECEKWEHACITNDCPHSKKSDCYRKLVEDFHEEVSAINKKESPE